MKQSSSFYDSSGLAASPATDDVFPLTSNWKPFKYTFFVPSSIVGTMSSSASFDIRLYYQTCYQAGNFDIANVQLEYGNTATPFEHRSYGEELALCQRYYQKVPSSGWIYDHCVFHWGTDFFASHTYMQTMRAAPSVTITTTGTYYEGGSSYSHGSITARQSTPDSLNFHAATNGGISGYAGAVYFSYTADAEL